MSYRLVGRTQVAFEGKIAVFFGGTDYHRLTSEPTIVDAVRRALDEQPLAISGSRATTANHPWYAELEAALAALLDAPEVVLLASGYMANAAALQGMREHVDTAFIEERSHPSLFDAAAAAGMACVEFPRHQVHGLEAALKDRGLADRYIVLCDGVAPVTGECAPLDAYARHGALLVDDCHGVGVVGSKGQGSVDRTTHSFARVVQTGTLSKALGGFGGWIATTSDHAARIRATRTYVGSTPIPLHVAKGATAAIRFLVEHPERLVRLRDVRDRVVSHLAEMGARVVKGGGAVIAVETPHGLAGETAQDFLVDEGVVVPFLRYPGGPPGGVLRIALSSVHTDDELEILVKAFRKLQVRAASESL